MTCGKNGECKFHSCICGTMQENSQLKEYAITINDYTKLRTKATSFKEAFDLAWRKLSSEQQESCATLHIVAV